MTWISLSVFVLLTIGIVAICDIRFTALFERLVKSHGGSTLAEDLEVMSGNTPTRFFKRESYEVEQILKATGRENKFESIKTFSIIGFAVGCLLALLMGNGFLVPVLGIALPISRSFMFAQLPVHTKSSSMRSWKQHCRSLPHPTCEPKIF